MERIDTAILINNNFQKKHEEMITGLRIELEKCHFEKASNKDLDILKDTMRKQIY